MQIQWTEHAEERWRERFGDRGKPELDPEVVDQHGRDRRSFRYSWDGVTFPILRDGKDDQLLWIVTVFASYVHATR